MSGLLLLLAALPLASDAATLKTAGGTIVASNKGFRLELRGGKVVSLESRDGTALADGYEYAFVFADEAPGAPAPAGRAQTAAREPDGVRVKLSLRSGPLAVDHELFLPDAQPILEETLSVRNDGRRPVAGIDFGFTRRLGALAEFPRLAAIPWGRSLMNPRPGYPSYRVEDLVKGLELEPRGIRSWGSEAWAFDGEPAFMVSKLSPAAVEYSVLRVQRERGALRLRFGGAANWVRLPESTAPLAPGASARLAPTRYELARGGWKGAFYAYRARMEAAGYGPRKGYAPLLFWNELFDNPGLGNEFPPYDGKRIEEEAKKASALGVEGLYLDPGWDSDRGSAIWPESRSGPLAPLVKKIARLYGLPIGVHTPLSSMTSARVHPKESWRLIDGRRVEEICTGAQQYQDEQYKRLSSLAENGISYMMFDGTRYMGDCEDPAHGHPVPFTRESHIAAVWSLLERVKRAFPRVVVELHDPLNGGQLFRLSPMYLLYDRKHSFDEAWASEFMLLPLKYLLDGPAKGLYYYNLAYSLPLYQHIELRDDTLGGLAFWWYASTCRRLGIGGTSPNPALRHAQKESVRLYRAHSAFFKKGVFWGLGEDAHAHTLPERRESVLVLFNFENAPARKTLAPSAAELGLTGELEPSTISLELPPRSARLVKVRAR